MFHNFNKAYSHEERCSKYPSVVIYGKRDGGRYGGRIGTATKPAAGAVMEVTDTSNNDYDIVTTVSTRQHESRIRAGDGGKAQDKSGVIKVRLLPSPSSLFASAIFFHAPKM